MATKSAEDTFADELTHDLVRMDGIEPWHLKPTEDGARLLVGTKPGLVRGTLDGAGYSVTEANVPVRDGFAAVLEVTR